MTALSPLLLSVLLLCHTLADGWLGIYLDTDSERPRIAEVVPDSPAARAGLQAGDVVVALDGKAMKDREAFVAAIRAHKAGDRVRLTLDRDGTEVQVVVRLGERPGDEAAEGKTEGKPEEPAKEPQERTAPAEPRQPRRTGAPLAEGQRPRAYLGAQIGEEDEGLVILRVVEDGPAAKAGVRDGERIVAWNGKEVDTADDLMQRLGAAKPGDEVTLKLEGEQGSREVEVELGARPQEGAQDRGPAVAVPAQPTEPAAPLEPRRDRARTRTAQPPAQPGQPARPAQPARPRDDADAALREELEALRNELRELRKQVEELKKTGRTTSGEPRKE